MIDDALPVRSEGTARSAPSFAGFCRFMNVRRPWGVAGMSNAKAGETRLATGGAAFHALVDITKSLLQPMTLATALDQILSQVEALFGYEICSVILPAEREDTMYMAAHRGYDPEVANTIRLRIGRDGIVGHVAATGKPHYAPDVTTDPYYIRGSVTVKSQFAMPLIVDGKVIGVLDVESDRVDAFPEDIREMLEAFAALVALAIYRAQHQERLEHLALTDGLTGLANNRAFWEALHRELSRARRFNHPLTLLMLEIDRFKLVNDTYGHLKGDEALRGIAQILGLCCRTMDTASRFGGDEFALILPQTTKSDARVVAERIRNTIHNYRLDGHIRLTVSIGLSAFPEDGLTPNALFAVADYAMYRIKDLGGDGISSETPSGPTALL